MTLAAFLLVGCVSQGPLRNPPISTSKSCLSLFSASREQATDEQLDRVSDLFHAACYREVIQLLCSRHVLNNGDLVIMTRGDVIGEGGGTNLLKILRVGEQ